MERTPGPELGLGQRGADGDSWKAGQVLRGRPTWYEQAPPTTKDVLNSPLLLGVSVAEFNT